MTTEKRTDAPEDRIALTPFGEKMLDSARSEIAPKVNISPLCPHCRGTGLDADHIGSVNKMVTTNAEPQSGAAGAGMPVPSNRDGDAGVAPGQSPALPHHIADAGKMIETPRVRAVLRAEVSYPTELLLLAFELEREAATYKLAATMQRENQEHAEAEADKLRRELAEANERAQNNAVRSNKNYERAEKVEGEVAALKHDIERAVAENTRLLNENLAAEDAMKDALSGWRYIRSSYGDLYGVGWDRVEEKLTAAIKGGKP